MIEKDIFEENNKFIVRKEIDGELIDFATCLTLDEAILIRDDLEEDGWPYLRENIYSNEQDYGQFISKENDKYVVSREINGENKIFGKFNSLDAAKSFKYKLIENGWDASFRGKVSKYGRYIRKEGNKFKITKNVKGERLSFGPFSTLDEALIVRDELIETNWGFDEDISHASPYGRYIAFVGDIFRVVKSINGTPHYFGKYDTLENAKIARDILTSNNWDDNKIPEELYSWRQFISYNFSTNTFELSINLNNEYIFFGLFDTQDIAKKALKILKKNNWDATKIPFDLYSKHSHIRHIVRGNNNIFQVIRKLGKEFAYYNSFDNLDEAIYERNKLISSNWVIEEPSEEKYDEFIYLRSDGKFYLKNEVNGEMRIFGIFDNFLDAINARLDCMKSSWNVDSISESEFFNENISEVVTQLSFPVTVGKSYKNKGWAVKRSYLLDLIQLTDYELRCKFIIEGKEIMGKLNLHTRLFYSNKFSLSDYLESLAQSDDKIQCIINLPLNYGTYKFNNELKFLDFKTKFSKSFKQGMFAMPRSVSKNLFNILPYESNCTFYLDDIETRGKLNIETRILFKDDELISYLKEFKEDNEEITVRFLV